MPTAKDGEKVEHVLTVKTGRCRRYLEKVFKENLKGGRIYEASCNWLTGIKLAPSGLVPQMLEKVDHDNDVIEDTADYSSLIKKVLMQNTRGGVVHKFSYNWFTGARLTPVAFLPRIEKRFSPDRLLSLEGNRSILALVLHENLREKTIILHEYSGGKMTANLTPIFPYQRASAIPYDHRIFYVHKRYWICHHFIRSTGAFAWIDKKIVIQPHRISPFGVDDHQHHRSGPVHDQQ